MYRLQSRYGGFLMPRTAVEVSNPTHLKGYGQSLGKHYLIIPQGASSYEEFCTAIYQSEIEFERQILTL